MPPLRKSISLAAPCGPSLSGHLEKGGHARAGKRPVSEYGPKRRRLPLREVPGLLCPRGARAKSVHPHLPSRMVEAIRETLFPLFFCLFHCEMKIPVRECYTIVTLAIVNGMGNVFCRRIIPQVSIVWTHDWGESAMC